MVDPAIATDDRLAPIAWVPPLVPVALGLVAGSALAPVGGPEPLAAWWWIGLPLALAALRCHRLGYTVATGTALFAAALLLGRLWAPPLPVQPPPSRLLSLEARVERVYYQGTYSQGVLLAAAHPGLPGNIIFARLPPLPPLLVDDRLTVDGVLCWDDYRGALRPRFDGQQVREHHSRYHGPRSWAWRAVDRFAVHRDLAVALLLGQERPMSGATFRTAGLAHILAVSGLHLAVVMLGSAALLAALRCPWWWRQAAIVAIALAYLWLTAAAIPTRRATIMTVVIILCHALRRSPHPWAPISLAAVVLLLLEPADGQRLGFQLSVAAVFGIVTLGRELILARRCLPLDPWPLDRDGWRWLLWMCRYLLDGLAIGCAATLATAPVLALHLGVAHPWSILATILATPLLMLVLLCGLPLLVLAGLFPAGPWEGLYRLCEAGLEGLLAVAEHFASWPGARLEPALPPWWLVVAWIALFWPCRRLRWLALKVPALAILLGLWWAIG